MHILFYHYYHCTNWLSVHTKIMYVGARLQVFTNTEQMDNIGEYNETFHPTRICPIYSIAHQLALFRLRNVYFVKKRETGKSTKTKIK